MFQNHANMTALSLAIIYSEVKWWSVSNIMHMAGV